MSKTATPTQQARSQGQVIVPFAQASRHTTEVGFDFTITPGTTTQTIGPTDLVPDGFIRDITIEVSTQTAGTLGPGAVGGDFPFNIFQNLQFIDTGGQKMDDLPGYALLTSNKIGGYLARSDPRGESDFSANPISPHFRLRLEREIFPDGRGALPNLSGSQKYRLRAVIDALSNIYTTAPTTAPLLHVKVIQHVWALPASVDGGQRTQERQPPLMGMAQYRTSWYPSLSITNARISEEIKATGNLVKSITLIGRDSSGVRTDAVFPDPFTLRVDNSYPYDAVPLSDLIQQADTLENNRVQRDVGVIYLPFNYGRGRHTGADGTSSWLATSTATYLRFTGNQLSSTNGTIDILVEEVSVAEVNATERSSMGSSTGTWNPSSTGGV